MEESLRVLKMLAARRGVAYQYKCPLIAMGITGSDYIIVAIIVWNETRALS